MRELTRIFDEKPVRVVVVKGEPWFVASEVCSVLGIGDTSQAMARLDDDERLIRTLDVSGQRRETWTINESGLYTLVLRSNKPEARRFRKWITAEILPAIRKTGAYSVTAEARRESAAARSALCRQWQEHGADKFYHYVNLTRNEYGFVFGDKKLKKADMTAKQLAVLMVFEAVEHLTLVNNPEIAGYHELDDSLKKTAATLPLFTTMHLKGGKSMNTEAKIP